MMDIEKRFIDKNILELKRVLPDGTIYAQTVTWSKEPTEENVSKAVELFANEDGDTFPIDSGHYVRLMYLWLFKIHFHHDWGPPKWTFPKVKLSFSNGVEFGIGWRFHAYTIVLRRREPNDA